MTMSQEMAMAKFDFLPLFLKKKRLKTINGDTILTNQFLKRISEWEGDVQREI
jgi:hypothetical protein